MFTPFDSVMSYLIPVDTTVLENLWFGIIEPRAFVVTGHVMACVHVVFDIVCINKSISLYSLMPGVSYNSLLGINLLLWASHITMNDFVSHVCIYKFTQAYV